MGLNAWLVMLFVSAGGESVTSMANAVTGISPDQAHN